MKILCGFFLFPYLLFFSLAFCAQIESKVIMTTLAGKRENLKILFRYVDRLLDLGLIDEYHVWDYTHWKEDEEWLRNQSFIHNLRNGNKFFFHIAREKGNHWDWNEYYLYYASKNWSDDDVLIKTDDDVLFIDVHSFSKFIKKRRAHRDLLLAIANTINNGVCAYHQYQFMMQPRFFPNECLSPLWQSAQLGLEQHEFFCFHYRKVLNIAAHLPEDQIIIHPIGTRISPNFYAIMGKDVQMIYGQITQSKNRVHLGDEFTLIEYLPQKLQRAHYIDPAMIVSHGSFYIQREMGLDEWRIQTLYTEVANTFLDRTAL